MAGRKLIIFIDLLLEDILGVAKISNTRICVHVINTSSLEYV